MIMLEDSLRDMFAARVESPPVADDPAGTAIRRGRSVRRRQTTASSLAVAIALVLTVGGVMSVSGGWPSGPGGSSGVAGFNAEPAEPLATAPVEPAGSVEPTSPARDNGIGLDLRVGDQLWSTDGRRMSLAGVGEVTRVYRVPAGWVYAGASKVRLLRLDGSSLSLSGEDDRWVLSDDGGRIAFLLDTTLFIAGIGPAGMAVVADVEVPAETWPVAFTANRVVLSDGPRGYGFVDLGQPSPPSWNADVTTIYGARGAALTGLVRDAGGSGSCLASLGATGAELRPTRTGGCALDLGTAAPDGRLAPGEGWLAERRATDVALVDVGRVLDGGTTVVSCPVASSVAPVWADARTVVAGDERGVVRCSTDGTEQVVPLPEGVGDGWQPVPRLMAGAGVG